MTRNEPIPLPRDPSLPKIEYDDLTIRYPTPPFRVTSASDIEVTDCTVRYLDPHPSWDPNNYRNTIVPPADLREFQARFDAEHAERGFGPVPSKQLRSRLIPFALIFGLALWTVFGMWVVERLS